MPAIFATTRETSETSASRLSSGRRRRPADRRRTGLSRATLARQEAAADRKRASQDRWAGADERTQAELDRNTSLADRWASATDRTQAEIDRETARADRRAGADERTQAQLDRDIALGDRGASAKERAYSSIDDLTGAYLRNTGFVELEREIARTRRTERQLVLAFVDVDGLKAVNDSRGHAAGDLMLVEVCETLRAELGSHDLIIRYGGDEFVCAIAGVNATYATRRLALVNAALAKATEPGSVAVGIAELQPGDTAESLVARADAALYSARQHQN